MKEITNEEHKEIMLGMLDDFDKFCKKHKLTYYVAYGTLVGALRHQGFIPWDDDIDIEMPRPDYERLKKLTETEIISEKTVFLDYRNKRCFSDFGKLYDNRTVSIDNKVKYRYEPLGVDIDVFVLDGYPEDEKESARHCKRKRKILELVTLNKADFKSLTLKEKFKKIILLPLVCNLKLIWKMHEKQTKKYPFESSSRVGRTLLYYSTDVVLEKELYKDTVEVTFEGMTLPAPCGYEKIVLDLYGIDYKTLPPKEYQVSHHDYTAYWKGEVS